ncbi:hypothetical protein [Priestia megaterium]|uniref:hypothetical protein n=1 Tax=Priestia megaterium TaxID=1404 RepID=UPI0028136922|nr:hypothetical protein [Priestia megaterium]MDR0128703.1 hypothetical protein [Priestia megaterium]
MTLTLLKNDVEKKLFPKLNEEKEYQKLMNDPKKLGRKLAQKSVSEISLILKS